MELAETSCVKHTCTYPECHKTFSRPWRLAAHMCKHTKEKLFACSEKNCSKKYTSLSHLRRHEDNVHQLLKINDQIPCPEEDCIKVFSSKHNMRRHVKSCHSKEARAQINKCHTCGKTFRSKNSLAKHEYVHTDNPPFKCKQCNFAFTDYNLWRKHEEDHAKTYLCNDPGCNKSFSVYNLLRKHKLEHSINVQCPVCKITIRFKRNLEAHLQTHLPKHEREFFACPYEDCSRSYTGKYNLSQHIERYHKGRKFVCDFPGCGKSLASKQKLDCHKKLHAVPQIRVKKQVARNRRKDAGKPKKAMAVMLSGVSISHDEHKKILKSTIICDTSDESMNQDPDHVSMDPM